MTTRTTTVKEAVTTRIVTLKREHFTDAGWLNVLIQVCSVPDNIGLEEAMLGIYRKHFEKGKMIELDFEAYAMY